MQIEKITDNSYNIFMSAKELETYDITVSTLTYGSLPYRRLMASVIRELETYHGFSHDDLPIKAELCPIGDDLFITIKTFDEADELDPRFSNFSIPSELLPETSSQPDETDDEDDTEITDDGDTNIEADDFMDEILPEDAKLPLKDATIIGSELLLEYNSYEELITSIKAVDPDHFIYVPNKLYLNTTDHKLYLTLKLPKTPIMAYKDLIILLEYARLSQLTEISRAFLNEHCTCVISSKAIDRLAGNS